MEMGVGAVVVAAHSIRSSPVCVTWPTRQRASWDCRERVQRLFAGTIGTYAGRDYNQQVYDACSGGQSNISAPQPIQLDRAVSLHSATEHELCCAFLTSQRAAPAPIFRAHQQILRHCINSIAVHLLDLHLLHIYQRLLARMCSATIRMWLLVALGGTENYVLRNSTCPELSKLSVTRAST